MKIIEFEDTGLDGDGRKRSLNEVARVDFSIYCTIPQTTLNKMREPGRALMAIDVVREIVNTCDTVGDVLRKLDKYSDGAVMNVSGR